MNMPYGFDGKKQHVSRIYSITILASLLLVFPAFADGTRDAIGIDLEVVVDGVSNSREFVSGTFCY